MLNHCNIRRLPANETKYLQYCTVDVIESGAVVNGDHNTFRMGFGFSGTGNHNYFEQCSHVEWTGNHCILSKNTTRMTITGNHTFVQGQDCLVIGSHTNDQGKDTTLHSEHDQGESRPNTLGRVVFNQAFQQGFNQTFDQSSGPATQTSSYISGRPVFSGYPPQLLIHVPGVVQPPLQQPPAIEYPTSPTNPEPVTEDPAKMCSICMDREKCTVAIPCGCRYACITCVKSSKPKTCALCRTPLKGIYRIYGE